MVSGFMELIEDISVMGIIGLILATLYAISIFMYPNKHFNFQERVLQSEIVNKRVYGDLMEFGYMIARFIIITLLVVVISLLMIKLM